jgi:hypothetical protein
MEENLLNRIIITLFRKIYYITSLWIHLPKQIISLYSKKIIINKLKFNKLTSQNIDLKKNKGFLRVNHKTLEILRNY